jgi:hypothetical protein
MKMPSRRGIIQWAVIVVALVLIGLILYKVNIQANRVDALAEALGDEQSAAEGRGETPVAPDPKDLLEDPDYRGPQGEPGPPPTDAQVFAAVESYFRANPVESVEPTPTAIAAAVSNYLTEHPPAPGEPGPPPTAEQISTAVADYLTENPPASGPPGPQGERGPPPSPEDVAAAVEDYLTDHPLPMCPEGYEASAETVLTTDGPIQAVICTVTESEEPEGD